MPQEVPCDCQSCKEGNSYQAQKYEDRRNLYQEVPSFENQYSSWRSPIRSYPDNHSSLLQSTRRKYFLNDGDCAQSNSEYEKLHLPLYQDQASHHFRQNQELIRMNVVLDNHYPHTKNTCFLQKETCFRLPVTCNNSKIKEQNHQENVSLATQLSITPSGHPLHNPQNEFQDSTTPKNDADVAQSVTNNAMNDSSLLNPDRLHVDLNITVKKGNMDQTLNLSTKDGTNKQRIPPRPVVEDVEDEGDLDKQSSPQHLPGSFPLSPDLSLPVTNHGRRIISNPVQTTSHNLHDIAFEKNEDIDLQTSGVQKRRPTSFSSYSAPKESFTKGLFGFGQ